MSLVQIRPQLATLMILSIILLTKYLYTLRIYCMFYFIGGFTSNRNCFFAPNRVKMNYTTTYTITEKHLSLVSLSLRISNYVIIDKGAIDHFSSSLDKFLNVVPPLSMQGCTYVPRVLWSEGPMFRVFLKKLGT